MKLRWMVGAVAMTVATSAYGYDAQTAEVMKQIREARKCKAHSECVRVGKPWCMVGCDIIVNRKHQSRISKMIDTAPTEFCKHKMSCRSDEELLMQCLRTMCTAVSPNAKPDDPNAADKAQRHGVLKERINALTPGLKHTPHFKPRLLLIQQRINRGQEPTASDMAFLQNVESRLAQAKPPPPPPPKSKRKR